MALVTFSSPELKDKTVYAVAGSHTETVEKALVQLDDPIDQQGRGVALKGQAAEQARGQIAAIDRQGRRTR